MKTARWWQGVGPLASILLVMPLLLACGTQRSTAAASRPAQPVTAVAVAASYITATSLADLVGKSTVIAIGQLGGTGEIINMARNPSDVTQPDPEYFEAGQVYHIVVQRYLKGQGEGVLNVVQPEAFFVTPVGSPTAADIERAKANYKHIPVRPGVPYLLFLTPMNRGFPTGRYWTGPAHPWRFTIPAGQTAQPESPWDGASRVFLPQPTTTLIAQVEQLVNTQR